MSAAATRLPPPPRGSTSLHATRDRKARSKRQERFGHLVRSEVAQIVARGAIRGGDILEADLRQRIAVVAADVSPDLRQARLSVSIRGGVDKRKAYAWLVSNTKHIKHALAQKLSHLKQCPNLTFVQVDVAAATDVMYLIDKISTGYKRETLDLFSEEELLDMEEWEDDDDDFFSS